jgi:Bacterial protein of unknown function (DUF839)
MAPRPSSFWRGDRQQQYLELGTTLSLHSSDDDLDDDFSVENASSTMGRVYQRQRRRREMEGEQKKKKNDNLRCSCSFGWILFGLFLLLVIPMIGLSLSAGLQKRGNIFRPGSNPKQNSMEDQSGFDQDRIVDKAFAAPSSAPTDFESPSPIVPSQTPVVHNVSKAASHGPSSSAPSTSWNDHVAEASNSSTTPTLLPTPSPSRLATLVPTPTLSPTTMEPSRTATAATEMPTLAPSTLLPSAMTLPTFDPTVRPTDAITNAPSIGPTQSPVSVFLQMIANHGNLTLPPKPTTHDGTTIPTTSTTVLYISVGDSVNLLAAGVNWQGDTAFFQTTNSGGGGVTTTTLSCMDMKPQPLRALFCSVRVGDQSYEIPIKLLSSSDHQVTMTNGATYHRNYTAVLYVYQNDDDTPFTVSVGDDETAIVTDSTVGVYQVTTPPFVVADGDDVLSIRVRGQNVAVAAVAIVAEEMVTAAAPTNMPVTDNVEEKEYLVEDSTPGETASPAGGQPVVVESPSKPTGASAVTPTYIPGDLQVNTLGLSLSRGLQVRLVATSGKPIEYADGSFSDVPFHVQPDAGATYALDDGGWIYVSNSEAKPDRGDDNANRYPGGVGAFTFSADGELLKYEMVLNGTRANCGGGRTPWGAWISGEEYHDGKIWQVDPTGERPGRRITMGELHPGLFESFAYDVRDMDQPRFYVTKDDESGALRRLYVSFWFHLTYMISSHSHASLTLCTLLGNT